MVTGVFYFLRSVFNALLSIICSLLDTLKAPAWPASSWLVSVGGELAWGLHAGIVILMERHKRRAKPRLLFPLKAHFKTCFFPWKRDFLRGWPGGVLAMTQGWMPKFVHLFKTQKARIYCMDVFLSAELYLPKSTEGLASADSSSPIPCCWRRALCKGSSEFPSTFGFLLPSHCHPIPGWFSPNSED